MYAKEFIHQTSIGNQEECFRVGKALVSQIRNWEKEGKIIGFEGRVIHNEKGIAEALIFFEYQTFTKNTFPFVYFVIQMEEAYETEILAYLTQTDYLEINTEHLDFRKSLGNG